MLSGVWRFRDLKAKLLHGKERVYSLSELGGALSEEIWKITL